MHKKIVLGYSKALALKCVPIVIGLCGFLLDADAQRIDVLVNNKIVINRQSYVIYAEILSDGTRSRPRDKSFYHWYSANDIKRTRGGYDGKLLHGKYTEFYADKDLKVKGNFRKGIKRGKWKTWHPDGQYDQVVKWKRHGRIARFREYNASGILIRKGRFKDEIYDGVISDFTSDKPAIKRFRNGLEVKQDHKIKTDTTSVGEKKRSRNSAKEKVKSVKTTTREGERRLALDSASNKKTLRKKIRQEQKAVKRKKEDVEPAGPAKGNSSLQNVDIPSDPEKKSNNRKTRQPGHTDDKDKGKDSSGQNTRNRKLKEGSPEKK